MRRALLLSVLLWSCRRAHSGAGSRPARAPGLEVTTLADLRERPAGIALDASYIYFPTDRGVFRVARAGGEPEAQPASGWVVPAWSSAHRRIAMTTLKLSGRLDDQDAGPGPSDDGYRYLVNGVFVLRQPRAGGAEQILARSLTNEFWSKPLVIDDTRVYWVEPVAGALVTVPKVGGAVTLLCQPISPADYDLALHGDRLYLLNEFGELSSLPAVGGARQIHGHLGSAHRMWMAAADDALYVVSDLPDDSSGRASSYQGQVFRVAYPRASWPPALANDSGLFFHGQIRIKPGGVPDPTDLDRLEDALGSLSGPLAAGQIPITVAFAVADTIGDAGIDAEVGGVESWLRAHLGHAVRLERRRRQTRSTSVGDSVDVGIDGQYIPALFTVR